MRKIILSKTGLLGFSMLYIYIPIVIFLLGFTKLYIAIPVLLVVGYGIRCIFKEECEETNPEIVQISVWALLLTLIFVIALAVLCGWGGLRPQTSDWSKHNAVLRDLVEKSWPVYYVHNEKYSMLSYYIAQYLVAGLIGKIFHSFTVASVALAIWNAAGVYLLVMVLYHVFHAEHVHKQLLILGFLTFFGGALVLVNYFSYRFFGGAISSLTNPDWLWGTSFCLQYRSNFAFLQWAFPQWIVPALMGVWLWQLRTKVQHYVTLFLPCMLYASLSFLGILPILLLQAVVIVITSPKKQKTIGQLFSLQNILVAIGLGGILFLYFYGNIFLEKPAEIGFARINYGYLWPCYVFFVLFMFGIHMVLIARNYYRNPLFWGMGIVLLVLPMFRMGRYNDLVMGASAIPLFLLQMFLIDFILTEDKRKHHDFNMGILTVFLLLGMFNTVMQMSMAGNATGTNLYDEFHSLENKADWQDETIDVDDRYNYYSYDVQHNIFCRYVARTRIGDK